MAADFFLLVSLSAHPEIRRLFLDPVLVSSAFLLAFGTAAMIWYGLNWLGGRTAAAVAPGEKMQSLEGLRGLLAFSVVVHHASCWYWFTNAGHWNTGQSIVFQRLATFGVIQFFYISGYLFWRKLMKRGRIPLGSFYLSRFIRIGPPFYFCVAVAIFIGVLVTGVGLHVTPGVLVRSLVPWMIFCIGGEPSVNGADTLRILSGVPWTLALEWGFYLLLPFLGWFSLRRRRLIYFALTFGVLFLVFKHASSGALNSHFSQALFLGPRELSKFMLIGFGGGILVAAIEARLRMLIRLTKRAASFTLLALYLTYLFVPGIESSGEILLLAGFALVILGTDLFGFISSAPVRVMGIVSYDLYLVHGIIFYVAMLMRGGMRPVTLAEYIPETAICMVVALGLATVMHFAVERPAMSLSERVARAVSGTHARLQPQPEPARVAAGLPIDASAE